MTRHRCDPVGVHELAQRLGVTRQAVLQLRRRGSFPEPLATLAAGPVWFWPDVAAWAVATGRLAEDGTPTPLRTGRALVCTSTGSYRDDTIVGGIRLRHDGEPCPIHDQP